MFMYMDDMLRLNEICRDSATMERRKMTEELINHRKFSSEEVEAIIDLSLDDVKELAKQKK